MPWFEPCASHGYTKFLENPSLREDRFVVSDTYLQALLQSYRQGYVNAGGPDYEDSDSILLDTLAENCVGSTSGAAALGEQQAAADIASGQTYHPQSLSSVGTIPSTPSTGAIDTMATVYTTGTSPAGQPSGEHYTGAPIIAPSPATSGPASAFGYGPLGAGTTVSGSGGILGQGSGIPWLLILAAAAGVYFLTRKG